MLKMQTKKAKDAMRAAGFKISDFTARCKPHSMQVLITTRNLDVEQRILSDINNAKILADNGITVFRYFDENGDYSWSMLRDEKDVTIYYGEDDNYILTNVAEVKDCNSNRAIPTTVYIGRVNVEEVNQRERFLIRKLELAAEGTITESVRSVEKKIVAFVYWRHSHGFATIK